MSKIIYVGFYTSGKGYENEARELIKTLDNFELDYEISAVPCLKDWQKNTQYKAVFLREKMNQYPGHPLVWVDVDARIRQQPTMLHQLAEMKDYDIAVHYFKEKELLSGTLYIAPTAAARRTIDAWIERNAEQPDVWDQKNLQWVLENSKDVQIKRLPAEYCFIFDISKKNILALSQLSSICRQAVG